MPRRFLLALAVVLAAIRSVRADPPEASPKAAADAVLGAWKEAAALKALAAKDDPDPWIVVDALLARGETAAAQAFAAASPRPDVETLPAYVRAWHAPADDAERRAAADAAREAVATEDPARLAGILREPPRAGETSPPVDVVGIRLVFSRAIAAAATGNVREGLAGAVRVADAAEALGWLRCASNALDMAVEIADEAGDAGLAVRLGERRLALERKRGDPSAKAKAMLRLGVSQGDAGQATRALDNLVRAREAFEALKDEQMAAWALAEVGNVQNALGERAKAREALEQAVERMKANGDRRRLPPTMGNLASVLGETGEFQRAFDLHLEARAMLETLGNAEGVAASHMNVGNLHNLLGEYRQALEEHTKAHEAFVALGNDVAVAIALQNLANDHSAMGDVPKAIDLYERSLAMHERVGNRAAAGNVLGHLASTYYRLGSFPKAEAFARRSLAALEGSSNPERRAEALNGLASVLNAIGKAGEALPLHEEALAIRRRLANPVWTAGAYANVGTDRLKIGDVPGAIEALTKAVELEEQVGDHGGASHSWTNLAYVQWTAGKRSEAAASFEKAIAAAETSGSTSAQAYALAEAAECHGRDADPASAVKTLALAKRGADLVVRLFGGLADDDAASVRKQAATLFAVGAVAAARLDDATSAARFLEDGRAGALLESLRAREVVGESALPPEVLRAEAAARQAEAAASAAYKRALASGTRFETAKRRADLEAAGDAVQAVVDRIQREQKKAAGLLYPRSDDVATIGKRLAADEALVLYGMHADDAVAVVVRPTEARVVRLGSRADVKAACDALGLDDPSAAGALGDGALARLRAAVIAPLRLGGDVKRLLVSPEGALSTVPFAALVPGVDVAYEPSGTTLGAVAEHAGERGQGVLALGDPDYGASPDSGATTVFGYERSRGATDRAKRLLPLPHTRDEALAVGTQTLLGKEATEARLREALRGHAGRWRAIHFACHGLVDPDRPAQSSLALTAAPPDDGFWSGTEILRADLPADLVVLSACETGRGRVSDGEGILGLTRAFTFAGAPRVVCSLWKVDDDATRALMTKFYELWNPADGSPGLPTATALRRAQEHVRSQEKWKHPYFWAAWVLWGLPG
jgi:tetratricopeptide (TPR) repeat protein